MSSDAGHAVPLLSHVGQLLVEVAAPVDLGPSHDGRGRMVAILGGTLEGEFGSGQVLAGGADWQTVHDDGSVSVDAHYAVRLDGGDMVTIRSTGIRASTTDESLRGYFRTAIVMTAPATRPDLNRSLFLSTGTRVGGLVTLHLFRVD